MRLENNIPYIKYSPIDISQIQHRLNELDEKIWYITTSRQNYNNGPHAKTTNLVLQYCRGEPEVDTKFIEMYPAYKSGKLPIKNDLFTYPTIDDFKQDITDMKEIVLDEQLHNLTKKITGDLEQKFNGKSGLVCYARLPAGKIIFSHEDPGYYLSVVHRLHIPIFTNNMCIFKLGNHYFNMEEGYLYEINNQLSHGVENNGQKDRIHLIIDIIPNAILNNI